MFDPSCPRLSRASTPCFFSNIKDVDGRDKPGHDDGESHLQKRPVALPRDGDGRSRGLIAPSAVLVPLRDIADRSGSCRSKLSASKLSALMIRTLKSPLSRVMSSNVLSGLPEPLSALLFAAAARHRLEAGQMLFDAGDPGDGCYRLELGLLKVMVRSPQGKERIIAILGPGAIVGELSMIDGLPRSMSVVAIRDCALRFVSREAFEKCTAANPEICRYLLATLAARLREADEALAAAAFLSVKGRVARTLIELAKHVGQDLGAGRITIDHKISQGDLAAMAGVARENVNRALSEWEERKLVTQSPLYYCLNDIAALEREMDFGAN